MATSLIHIGDTHLAPGPRNAARLRALDQIITEGLALERLGGWLWPGDLFHAGSTVEDRNAIDERLQRMAARAPVVICYGNHDRPGDLDGFARLKAGFPIYVIDQPHCLRMRLATGENATVFVLPYPMKAGLVAAGVAPGDVCLAAGQALDAIFMRAGAELEQARAAGDLTLMIGHVNVSGAIRSNGQPSIGPEISIDVTHLHRLGPIYKGLNHIHKAQEIAGAHYAGSICRLDWGEIDEKRYLAIEVQRDGVTWEYRVGSRAIDVPPMYHVEGDLSREGFTWRLKDGQPPATWKGCEVRVRASYKASEKRGLSEAFIHAEFAEAARLEVELIAVPDRALRAPEVAAARTLADKLAAYYQLVELAPSVADRLAQLEHGDPQKLLSAVAAQLSTIEAGEEASVAA